MEIFLSYASEEATTAEEIQLALTALKFAREKWKHP
jgi:hypothetical protein